MTVETTFRHASDWIEWTDATGREGERRRPVSPERLSVELSLAPADLRVVHWGSSTKLWRERLEGSFGVQAGAFDAKLISPAPTALYDVAGVLNDPSGIFLPRLFNLQVGRGNGHAVALYRSPLGTTLVSGGGVRGSILFADGSPASWALVRIQVTPSVGAPLDFRTQADAVGDFLLPMDRVPALTKDAPSPTYGAKLRVFAIPNTGRDSPVNPDTLPQVKVATGVNGAGKPTFAQLLTFALTPGILTPLHSPGFGHLTIQAG